MKLRCHRILGAITLASLAGCGAAPAPPADRGTIDESKIVDLTYSFDKNTIYWPTGQPFTWKREAWGRTASGYWYTAGRYAASEHGGTHLDAPIHFAEGKQAADE